MSGDHFVNTAFVLRVKVSQTAVWSPPATLWERQGMGACRDVLGDTHAIDRAMPRTIGSNLWHFAFCRPLARYITKLHIVRSNILRIAINLASAL